MSNSKLHGNRRLRWSSERKVKNNAGPPQTRLLFPIRNRLKASEGNLFVENMHSSLSRINIAHQIPHVWIKTPESIAEIGDCAFKIKFGQITMKVLVCSDREKEFDLFTASPGCPLVCWGLRLFYRCNRHRTACFSLVSSAPLVYDKMYPQRGQ